MRARVRTCSSTSCSLAFASACSLSARNQPACSSTVSFSRCKLSTFPARSICRMRWYIAVYICAVRNGSAINERECRAVAHRRCAPYRPRERCAHPRRCSPSLAAPHVLRATSAESLRREARRGASQESANQPRPHSRDSRSHLLEDTPPPSLDGVQRHVAVPVGGHQGADRHHCIRERPHFVQLILSQDHGGGEWHFGTGTTPTDAVQRT